MRVVGVALVVLFLAAPAAANVVAYGANQVGTKTINTAYSNGSNALFVTVVASGNQNADITFQVAPPGGAFLELAECQPSKNGAFCTVAGHVPPSWSYKVGAPASVSLSFWYELEDIMIPIEVALASVWVLSFIGGVLVGRW